MRLRGAALPGRGPPRVTPPQAGKAREGVPRARREAELYSRGPPPEEVGAVVRGLPWWVGGAQRAGESDGAEETQRRR